MGTSKPRAKTARARGQRTGGARQPTRGQTAQAQLDQVTGFARDRVLERLDFQRGALAAALEDLAEGLEGATRRTPSPVSRQLLEAGGRVLRGASTRIDEHSVEELLERTEQLVKRRPGWAIAGLLGAGLLAGRVFKASGAGGGRES